MSKEIKNNYAPKFIVAIDHRANYVRPFTYIGLDAEKITPALVEGTIKAMKCEQVLCWIICKRTTVEMSGAYYKGMSRIYQCGTIQDVSGEECWNTPFYVTPMKMD